jgi:inorganic pyrophosphatase/exopolyphosphatase
VVEGEIDKEEEVEKVIDSHKCGVSETSEDKKTVTKLGGCVHTLANV